MKTKVLILVILLLIGCIWKIQSHKSDDLIISNKLAPITSDQLFHDSLYYNWCNSIIKGDNGKYHLIYSRFPKSKSFFSWLTNSEVALATADSPEGPYRYAKTLINVDQSVYKAGDLITAHNPKIKYFDGKYYIYFISTHLDKPIDETELIETCRLGYDHPNWKPLRTNQRTYIATATSIDGEWTINHHPILEPAGPIETLVVNPAITQGGDGRYYMIIKGDKPGTTKFERNQAVAISNYPDTGFVIQPEPMIQDWDTEDASIWYDKERKRFYTVFHAHSYLGLMTSTDGTSWEKATDFKLVQKDIRQAGTDKLLKPHRMERPFIYIEDGKPRVLAAALMFDDGDTSIVTIPIN